MSKILPICGALIMCISAEAAPGAFLTGIPIYAELVHQNVPGGPEVGDGAGPAVVGPGVEFTNFGAGIPDGLHPVHVNIDVSDTQVIVTAVNDQPPSFKEQLFINIDPFHTVEKPRITGLKFNPATNWTGFFNSASFNGDFSQLGIVVTGMNGSAGQQIVLDIIPEPSGGTLAAAAGAGLAAGRRRRT